MKCPRRSGQHRAHVSCVEQTVCDDTDSPGWIGAVNDTSRKDVCALMMVGEHRVRFQVDSGATVNLLPVRYTTAYRPTTSTLKMWDGSTYTPLGETTTDLTNPKMGTTHSVHFFVCDDGFRPLLGLNSVQELGLVSVNHDNFVVSSVTPVEQFQSVFDESLGKLPGSVTLHCKDGATPTVLPARRLPLAVQSKVRAELDRLCALGVLRTVTEPTDWVSQMAVASKRDGSMRVCIDPQSLNKVLQRERYQLPTFEDVLPMFSGAKVFSKLDVTNAFWHLELDKESSLLTTMTTPFGRYAWERLPFGLCVSSEIFQRHLCEALEGLDGVICVADDIVVTGVTKADHDAKLTALLQRCAEKGIKLNQKKCSFYCSKITFLGHVITAEGVSADPDKIRAIVDMPPPQDVHEVRRFCGMVQYLAKFLPSLSEVANPLRALTRKDVPWVWGQPQTEAFRRIKELVTSAPVLAHFRCDRPLVVQTDASQNALGAALLQDGKPIAFASRSLTDCEKRYAQIEKECLSVVFGLERFDQYTYGREVTVENDHKPLQSILAKPLSSAPKRLQAMMMALHRYSPCIVYRPGVSVVLADLLSRAPASAPSPDTSFIYSPSSERGFDRINALQYLPISDMRLREIREATAADPVFCDLTKVIVEGWPEKASVPVHLSPYYHIRDSLSVTDGIVFKGERIIIPQSMRKMLLQRLHVSHLGADSMLRRAREIIYWPGLTHDVQRIARSCDVCSALQPRQQREPLVSHDRGDYPWVKVGVDLFECNGDMYLVTVDYFSGWFEVDQLTSTVSTRVIEKLKRHFARFGVPQMLISENGRQFVSVEFERFCRDWGIEHRTSSPYHSRSNGMAESAVKVAKTLIRKTTLGDCDVYEATGTSNTSRQGSGLSPAQMMFGRGIRSHVPCANAHLLPARSDAAPERRQRAHQWYDERSRELPALQPGQTVRVAPSPATGPTWTEGVVVDRAGGRSYVVERHGAALRRNRIDLRPVSGAPALAPAAAAAPAQRVGDSPPAAMPSRASADSSDVRTFRADDSRTDDEVSENVPAPRRSSRVTRPPVRYGFE